MIRRISPENRLALRRRNAFTLLEVLVVVAIIVILATVSSIYVFRYLDDAKQDTARQNMAALEKACKAYMLKSGGQPPPNLQALITPPDGGRAFIEGGQAALMDPWNQQYQYDPNHLNQSNGFDPDPIVFTTVPPNNTILKALGRQ